MLNELDLHIRKMFDQANLHVRNVIDLFPQAALVREVIDPPHF